MPSYKVEDYKRKIVVGIGIKTVFKEALKSHIFSMPPRLVIFLSENSGGSDYIRIVGPVVLNEAFKDTVTLCLNNLKYDEGSKSFNISRRVLDGFDITVVVSRDKISQEAFSNLKLLKRMYPNVRLLVDLDDDLFSIQESHPEFEFYKGKLQLLKALIERSDVLTVSTPMVLEGVKRNCKLPDRYYVIPNYLDNRVWNIDKYKQQFRSAKATSDDCIKVLYSGTETHDGDLLILKNVFKAVRDEGQKRRVEVRFIIVGGTNINIPGAEIIKVPDEFREYDKYVKWLKEQGPFDLAIAPLDLNNPLNHAKSSLKYLEYSALGIPGIYTYIEPYTEVIESDINGILVFGNNYDGWLRSLNSLVFDGDMRINMGNLARRDISNNYLLSKNFKSLIDALDT